MNELAVMGMIGLSMKKNNNKKGGNRIIEELETQSHLKNSNNKISKPDKKSGNSAIN